jgi:hypothetical protein
MTARCCDSCRVFVLRALASLEADLVPCVHGLEQVEKHLYGGSEVRPSQDHGVSPRKATSGRKGVPRIRVVPDSSDTSSYTATIRDGSLVDPSRGVYRAASCFILRVFVLTHSLDYGHGIIWLAAAVLR